MRMLTIQAKLRQDEAGFREDRRSFGRWGTSPEEEGYSRARSLALLCSKILSTAASKPDGPTL